MGIRSVEGGAGIPGDMEGPSTVTIHAFVSLPGHLSDAASVDDFEKNASQHWKVMDSGIQQVRKEKLQKEFSDFPLSDDFVGKLTNTAHIRISGPVEQVGEDYEGYLFQSLIDKIYGLEEGLRKLA